MCSDSFRQRGLRHSVRKRKSGRIEDVNAFPGHIACDAASQSEIVLPIRVDGKIVGVLDIDSPVKNRFDEIDEKYLTQFAETLEKALAQ
ncbi:GAF domain-containing protein [Bacillus subtilis]|uniref:GAF domain-containing protein n=1 Tax=Bacillus subtilis TaxID=1423 RepID=UPI0031B82B1B